jgi:ribosome biogenesis GTPase
VEAVEEGRLGPGGAARLDSLQRLLETFAEKSQKPGA